jgi:hypothetical protein
MLGQIMDGRRQFASALPILFENYFIVSLGHSVSYMVLRIMSKIFHMLLLPN